MLRQGISSGLWKTIPIDGSEPLTGCPLTRTVPLECGSNPEMIFRSVLLLHPLGPTTETNSPLAAVREMFSSALTGSARPAYVRPTFCREMTESDMSLSRARTLLRRWDEVIGENRRRLERRAQAIGLLENFEARQPVGFAHPAKRLVFGVLGPEMLQRVLPLQLDRRRALVAGARVPHRDLDCFLDILRFSGFDEGFVGCGDKAADGVALGAESRFADDNSLPLRSQAKIGKRHDVERLALTLLSPD